MLVADVAQLAQKVIQVGPHDRANVGIGDRCARPFELEDLRRDIDGGADVCLGPVLLDDGLHFELVLAVDERVQQADRDTFDAASLEGLNGCYDVVV